MDTTCTYFFNENVLDDIIECTLEGGVTVNIFGEKPSDGWSVSIFPDLSLVFDNGEIDRDKLAAWIDANISLLRDGYLFVGGWFDKDTGKIYLDIVGLVYNRKYAFELGSDYNQIGVYNLATCEFMPTNGNREITGFLISPIERAKLFYKSVAYQRD